MANEISTAGIELLYASNNGTTTPPTTGWTKINNIKSIPEFNAEPSNLEVTDLSDTEWRRYIPGLREMQQPQPQLPNMSCRYRLGQHRWSLYFCQSLSYTAADQRSWL